MTLLLLPLPIPATGPQDQEVLGLAGAPDSYTAVCGTPFSESCPLVCVRPDGHPGFHIAQTKSDNINSISWPQEVAK